MIHPRLRRYLSAAFARRGEGPVWKGGGAHGLLKIDADGRIVSANAPAAALFGRRGVRGASLFELCEAADRAALHAALDARTGEAIIVGASGDGAGLAPRRLELRAEADGPGAVVLVIDRTEAEAERDRLTEEARAGAALLADLSHEMRTPLNAVIGFAEAMEKETFGPVGHRKYLEYAGHIRNSGAHLMDLTATILDLARHEAGRVKLRRVMVDLGAEAEACAAMVRGAAQEAGLALDVRVEEDLPASWLDPRAVKQILINLLANAVKFTSDGGVSLSVARDGETLVATVRDTGVGMSEAELARLGARFTAAHGDGVRGAKGAGLGLALAFALAEAHGGRMALKSAPGEGVEARVCLPIVKAPARPSRSGDRHADEVVVHSQLDRIDAYRREIAARRDAA